MTRQEAIDTFSKQPLVTKEQAHAQVAHLREMRQKEQQAASEKKES